MPRNKDSKETVNHGTGDFNFKQMILKVEEPKHSWIKTIAEETGMTQPNVVNMILGEAIKNDPKEYIDQIKKIHAKETLKKLDEEAKNIENERKRLHELLDK